MGAGRRRPWPRRHTRDVVSGSGTVRASGLTGPLDIRTDSGTVKLYSVRGPVTAHAGSGAVTGTALLSHEARPRPSRVGPGTHRRPAPAGRVGPVRRGVRRLGVGERGLPGVVTGGAPHGGRATRGDRRERHAIATRADSRVRARTPATCRTVRYRSLPTWGPVPNGAGGVDPCRIGAARIEEGKARGRGDSGPAGTVPRISQARATRPSPPSRKSSGS